MYNPIFLKIKNKKIKKICLIHVHEEDEDGVNCNNQSSEHWILAHGLTIEIIVSLQEYRKDYVTSVNFPQNKQD